MSSLPSLRCILPGGAHCSTSKARIASRLPIFTRLLPTMHANLGGKRSSTFSLPGFVGRQSSTSNRRRTVVETLSLAGNLSVITGGARGIGLAVANTLAEQGSDLALLDAIEPQIDVSELQQKFGIRCSYYRTDVSSQESLTSSFEQVVNDFGRIDKCLTAAGVAHENSFLDHTWEQSTRVLEVNVLGTFFAAQLAAQQMIKQGTGGSILMIASVAAHCALPSQRVSIYSASKAAVKHLGQVLAVELSPYKIRVNTISPGFIATDMTGSLAVAKPELYRVFETEPPLGRIGHKDDLTAAALYMLSDAASYTTGSDLPVTGALHCGRIKYGVQVDN